MSTHWGCISTLLNPAPYLKRPVWQYWSTGGTALKVMSRALTGASVSVARAGVDPNPSPEMARRIRMVIAMVVFMV